MAATSARHVWSVADFQALRGRFGPGECHYGPFFKAGSLRFQLHLYPSLDRLAEPGALYLVLAQEPGEARCELLKVKQTASVQELGLTSSAVVKDSAAQWRGGFGPCDPGEGAALAAGVAGFEGDTLTIEVYVEVLEFVVMGTTVLRWPFAPFEQLSASRGGFQSKRCCRLEVHGSELGSLALRADLHPYIDSAANFHISMVLEGADPRLGELTLDYELVLEELGLRLPRDTLHGSREDWQEKHGLRGKPVQIAELARHSGPLTLRMEVVLGAYHLKDLAEAPVWTDHASPEFRYLLVSSAGPQVTGVPGAVENDDRGVGFAGVCALNVRSMQAFLLERGVPRERICVACYDGASEQPHPRDLVESFLRSGDCAKLVIYYSGHAIQASGAWSLRWLPEGQRYSSDVTILPRELLEWKRLLRPHTPTELLVEAPGAGAWCFAAKDAQHDGRVLAACAAEAAPLAEADGSLFTVWLLGRGRALDQARRPGGRQVPWEYSRIGTVGPMRL